MRHTPIFTFLTLLLLLLTITPLHAQPPVDPSLTSAKFSEQFETRALQIIDAMEKDADKIFATHIKDAMAIEIQKDNPSPSQARLDNSVALFKSISTYLPKVRNENAIAFFSLNSRMQMDEILRGPLFLRDSPDKIETQIDDFCQTIKNKAAAGAVKHPIADTSWQALFAEIKEALLRNSTDTRGPHLKEPWPQTLTPGLVDTATAIIDRKTSEPAFVNLYANKQGVLELNKDFCRNTGWEIHGPVLRITLADRRARDEAFDALYKQIGQRREHIAPLRRQIQPLAQQYSNDQMARPTKSPKTQPTPATQPATPNNDSAI
jgi:hypothetical protein